MRVLLVPFLLLALAGGCAVTGKPGGFGDVQNLRSLPDDVVVMPTAVLDAGAGRSWLAEVGGFRTGLIHLASRFRARDVAAYYAVHMRIARWQAAGEPRKEGAVWVLAFAKGLDRCTVKIRPAEAEGSLVSIDLNPPKAGRTP